MSLYNRYPQNIRGYICFIYNKKINLGKQFSTINLHVRKHIFQGFYLQNLLQTELSPEKNIVPFLYIYVYRIT